MDHTIRQSYETNVSVALIRLYGFLLCTSLACGMLQSCWYHLRGASVRLSTVNVILSAADRLPTPIDWLAWRQAPAVCLMAAWLLLAIPIATIFPPGAMTVTFDLVSTIFEQKVPTYDPSLFKVEEDDNWSATLVLYADVQCGAELCEGNSSWYVQDLVCSVAYA